MNYIVRKVNHPNLEKKLKDAYLLIQSARSVLIAGHVSPDGDNVGSQLALGEYLQSIGKPFSIVWAEDLPKSFAFLPHVSWIINMKKTPVDAQTFDLFIALDSGDMTRLGEVATLIHSEMRVLNLDHHRGNTHYGHHNLVAPEVCSVGELLYYFFTVNRIPITYNMAVDLYVSIVTDSGSFKYDCMHKEVHLIAADLLDKGIVPSDFTMYLYQNKTPSYIRYITLALNRMELYAEAKIALSTLVYEDFMGQDEDETDGIIEYLGMLNTVSVYLLIKEKEKGEFTASLRSKHRVDVSRVAAVCGGGGHMRASGCKTDSLSLPELKQVLIQEIERQIG